MAVSLNNKLHRVLKLLIGLRNQRTLGLLKARGFTQEDLDEGWRLLRAATNVNLDRPLPELPTDSDLVDRLDAWENRWYVVAQATLGRRHPEIAREVFKNLPRTSGPELFLLVPVFIRRVKRLEENFGEEGKRAWEVLRQRGLTEPVLAQASAIIEQAGVPEASEPENPISPDAAKEAENAVWAYYREWSQILRVDLKDLRVLREIGLSPLKRRSGGGEDAGDLDEDDSAEEESEDADDRPDTADVRTDLPGGSPFRDQ